MELNIHRGWDAFSLQQETGGTLIYRQKLKKRHMQHHSSARIRCWSWKLSRLLPLSLCMPMHNCKANYTSKISKTLASYIKPRQRGKTSEITRKAKDNA